MEEFLTDAGSIPRSPTGTVMPHVALRKNTPIPRYRPATALEIPLPGTPFPETGYHFCSAAGTLLPVTSPIPAKKPGLFPKRITAFLGNIASPKRGGSAKLVQPGPFPARIPFPEREGKKKRVYDRAGFAPPPGSIAATPPGCAIVCPDSSRFRSHAQPPLNRTWPMMARVKDRVLQGHDISIPDRNHPDLRRTLAEELLPRVNRDDNCVEVQTKNNQGLVSRFNSMPPMSPRGKWSEL